MKKTTLGPIGFCIILALLITASGCDDNKVNTDPGDFVDMAKITISPQEAAYLLKSGRAMLKGEKPALESSQYPGLFGEDTRGVFLTMPRKNENALCAFGLGQGVFGALESAAVLIKRIGDDIDLDQLLLRIDVVEKTSELQSFVVSKKWSIPDRPSRGIITYTVPPVAMLPDEIIARNVINYRDMFIHKRFTQVLLDRTLGKILRKKFDKDMTIQTVTFTRFSFMETEPGKGIMPLLDGRKQSFPIDPDYILDAVKRGGDYLVKSIHENGAFTYEYWPQRNDTSTKYELRRHANACQALLDLYEVTGEAETLAKAELAINYLLDRAEGPSAKDKGLGHDFLAVYDDNGLATTGTAGATIIALARLREVKGGDEHLETMRKLARFISYMTASDGRQNLHYFKSKVTKTKSQDVTQNYPTECALALIKLHQIDKDQQWLDAAVLLMEYIAQFRKSVYSGKSTPHDLYLAEAVYLTLPHLNSGREYIVDYVFEMGESILMNMRTKELPPDWKGSFKVPPRGKQAAFRHRAIQYVCKIAQKRDMPVDKWIEAMKIMAGYQLRFQLDEVSSMFIKHPEKSLGAFFRGYYDLEVRIDYTAQHIISLLRFRDEFADTP